ncbi:halo transducer protein [Halosimplex sp. TS25]|uniref:halo transducer protein n=1 Tax=Halosimplex rarum TaxID=3396619 RepID=UPI0039E8A326
MTDTTHDADATEETTDAEARGGATGETVDAAGADATGRQPIDGLALDEAVERVVAREGERDPETVRAALEHVAEDGVVSGAAVADALKETSKLVATAETRTELAGIALDDAREAAEPVADLPTVAARLDRFAAEVSAVEERAAALGEAVQSVVDDREDPTARFAVADGIRRIESRSRTVQRTADDLQFDLEDFERWLDSHEVRVRELGDDVDALDSSLDALAAAVDDLADALANADQTAAGQASDGATEPGTDFGNTWFDATLRVRVIGLTVADLRAELADLRTWADREDVDGANVGVDGGLEGVEARLDDIEARRAALADRLDGLAEPDWRDRFGDRIDGFERDLDGLAPPVEWGAVERALEGRRTETESST